MGNADRLFEDRNRPGDENRHCCMGAAAMDNCTCWEVEHDRAQEPPDDPEDRPEIRETPCDDCACRPGSPENQGDPRVIKHDLEELARRGQPFFCHQGMRKPVREVHPDGAVRELDSEHRYDPPRREDGVPLKADGSPADICAGWAGVRKRMEREGDADEQ